MQPLRRASRSSMPLMASAKSKPSMRKYTPLKNCLISWNKQKEILADIEWSFKFCVIKFDAINERDCRIYFDKACAAELYLNGFKKSYSNTGASTSAGT